MLCETLSTISLIGLSSGLIDKVDLEPSSSKTCETGIDASGKGCSPSIKHPSKDGAEDRLGRQNGKGGGWGMWRGWGRSTQPLLLLHPLRHCTGQHECALDDNGALNPPFPMPPSPAGLSPG